MRDLLHDQKDALQVIREKWQHNVEAVRQEMVAIIRDAEDPRDVFVEANVLAADALASVTTEAAMSGYEFGKRKVAKGGGIGDQDETHAGEEG